MTKLVVSQDTYNEIASLLEQQGIKVGEGRPLQIEKGTEIKGPYDFRLVTIRRDCLTEASKCYQSPTIDNPDDAGWRCINDTTHFINHIDKVYQWVLSGEKPKEEAKQPSTSTKTKPKEWK